MGHKRGDAIYPRIQQQEELLLELGQAERGKRNQEDLKRKPHWFYALMKILTGERKY